MNRAAKFFRRYRSAAEKLSHQNRNAAAKTFSSKIEAPRQNFSAERQKKIDNGAKIGYTVCCA